LPQEPGLLPLLLRLRLAFWGLQPWLSVISAANVALNGCPGVTAQQKGTSEHEVEDEVCHGALAASWNGSPQHWNGSLDPLLKKCDNLCGEGGSIESISVYRMSYNQKDNCWNDGWSWR